MHEETRLDSVGRAPHEDPPTHTHTHTHTSCLLIPKQAARGARRSWLGGGGARQTRRVEPGASCAVYPHAGGAGGGTGASGRIRLGQHAIQYRFNHAYAGCEGLSCSVHCNCDRSLMRTMQCHSGVIHAAIPSTMQVQLYRYRYRYRYWSYSPSTAPSHLCLTPQSTRPSSSAWRPRSRSPPPSRAS